MFHCVHQLVANCGCLLFGAEQVEHSGFYCICAENKPIRAVIVNQKSKVAEGSCRFR